MLRVSETVTSLRQAAIVAGLCVLMLAHFSVRSFAAEDSARTNGSAAAAAADAPANAPEMKGCPGVNGSCCASGSCQENAAGKPADQATGGCPCQRAKQAQKGS